LNAKGRSITILEKTSNFPIYLSYCTVRRRRNFLLFEPATCVATGAHFKPEKAKMGGKTLVFSNLKKAEMSQKKLGFF